MNRGAASEMQLEDSKSHLSTYRKDDKIMLKIKAQGYIGVNYVGSTSA